MPTIKQMTKAQLVEHIARQDQELIAAGRVIEELRLAASIAQHTAAAPRDTSRAAYWDYVRSTKAAQPRGVKRYMAYDVWAARQGH